MFDLIVMLLAAGAGLVAHWLVRWSKGDIHCDFMDYMAKERRYSIASVATLLSVVATFYSAADAVALTKQTVAMMFMGGFMIDNTMNKAPE